MQLPKHKTDEMTGISYTFHVDYYLQDIDCQTKNVFSKSVEQLANREGDNGKAERGRSNWMGTANELYSKQSNRNCEYGFDLYIDIIIERW